MLKLIKLEWKKNNVGKYVRNALITVAVLVPFILAMAGELEGAQTVESYGSGMINASIDLFANMCFMVFTGAMLSAFIVGAYENRTMGLMFSYPIRRWKILVSKMLAVWIFNFAAVIVCKLVLYGAVVLTKSYTHVTADSIRLTDPFFYVQMLVGSAVMVSVSFLALPVGLMARSSKAAVIASVVVVCFTQGQIGHYTLVNNIGFHALLLALWAVAVFLTLRGVETRDVM